MVSVLAIYSDNPSSNPVEAYIFSFKFVFEKKENKQNEVGVGWQFQIKIVHSDWLKLVSRLASCNIQ